MVRKQASAGKNVIILLWAYFSIPVNFDFKKNFKVKKNICNLISFRVRTVGESI